MDLVAIAIVVAIGVMAGLFAGLLGIGGGVIMTPLLLLLFESQGMEPATAVVTALACSLAATVFTSIPSTCVHSYHKVVSWPTLAVLAPASLVGAALGALVALRSPSNLLIAALVVFLLYSATRILRPKPSANGANQSPPARAKVAVIGLSAGVIGAFTGTGGGIVVTPLLHRLGMPLLNCIGTSAGNVMFVGASATLVYAGKGLDFVVLAALAPSCMIAAVLGSYLANVMPISRLRTVYAVCILVIAARLSWWLIQNI